MENSSSANINNIIKNVRGIAPKHCDFCGNKYEDSDFQVIRTQAQQSVIHLQCRGCGNSYMLNIYNPMGGLLGSSRSQLNLDITDTKELMHFAGTKPVTSNEALDGYNLFARSEFLEEFFQSQKSTEAPKGLIINE